MFSQISGSFSNSLVILCLVIKIVSGLPANRNSQTNTNHDRFMDYSDTVVSFSIFLFSHNIVIYNKGNFHNFHSEKKKS